MKLNFPALIGTAGAIAVVIGPNFLPAPYRTAAQLLGGLAMGFVPFIALMSIVWFLENVHYQRPWGAIFCYWICLFLMAAFVFYSHDFARGIEDVLRSDYD